MSSVFLLIFLPDVLSVMESRGWNLQLFLWNCLFFGSVGRFSFTFTIITEKEHLPLPFCYVFTVCLTPFLPFITVLFCVFNWFCSESFWFPPHFLLCIFLDISLWIPWRWLLMFWIYYSLGQIDTSLIVIAYKSLCL